MTKILFPPTSKAGLLLAGDIGGTKALLGLCQAQAVAGQPRFVFKEKYACAGYATFSDLLAEFLVASGTKDGDISGGCLAIAGPVSGDGRTARLTNLPWSIDTELICRESGISHLALVNDFYAAAAGISVVAADDLLVLQAGQPDPRGVRLVIGAGTGLGMAVLVPQENFWRILPGEAGHTGFAPANAQQAALWAHLLKVGGRVSNERVISGNGLASIYRFLAGNDADSVVLGAADPAAAIAALAAGKPDGNAGRAMELFFSVYGAFAGDMALALMATGGVFLSGGIAVKNLPQLQSSPFIREFNAKAEHAALAMRMPVKVVTDLELGLKGAAHHALMMN
ncbi:Glucokinase [Georgfuchsia toluolica]|uniref:Glucokinase n=1 Tax=Georgfuchsia toluolica TaxID=424218 RepID=A0A916J227_9PROT|nr:glucokinase [Georgfuchsia toluolica]CAG4883162.1 Glucokinase [Georgfuchsia toluolica]